MWGSRELLLVWLLVLAAGGTEHVYRPGRRVCVVGVAEAPEAFVQRVYQPFLTTCDGHRACSTYRTLYRTAYRRSPGPALARPRYACCPGWRSSGLPGACAAAVCQPPCRNGGSCVRPGRCHCPAGWQGDTCQTDVDECSSGRSGCPQRCVNTAGSYWCQCWEGHSPSADGRLCLPEGGAPSSAPSPPTGADGAVREEVRQLRARVDALEQVRPGLSLRGGWEGAPQGKRPGCCQPLRTPWDGTTCFTCPHQDGPVGPPSVPVGFAAAGQEGTREPPGLSETQLSRAPAGCRSGSRGTEGSHAPFPTEAAAGAGPAAQPGLAGLGARAAGHGQPPGPLLPAAGPRRLSERADLLPGGAAGVMLLQEGAVTDGFRHPRLCWAEPPSASSRLLGLGHGVGSPTPHDPGGFPGPLREGTRRRGGELAPSSLPE